MYFDNKMCYVNNEIYINILTMKGICLEFLNNSKLLFPDPKTWGIGWKFPFPLSPDSPRIISCRGIGIPTCASLFWFDRLYASWSWHQTTNWFSPNHKYSYYKMMLWNAFWDNFKIQKRSNDFNTKI